jgi:hypothetical protein
MTSVNSIKGAAKWKDHIVFDALANFDWPLRNCDVCLIDYMSMPANFVKHK